MPLSETLKQAINAYNNDMNTLTPLTQTAAAELGANWYTAIQDFVPEMNETEQGKLNHALRYQAAIWAWNETQGYLTQTEPLDAAQIREKLSYLSECLSFFGEPGTQAITQLQEKINAQQPQSNETTVITESALTDTEQQSPETTSPLSADSTEQPEEQPPKTEPQPIFAVEKILRLANLTQSVQAWVSSRCIDLGNIEVFNYPYYGFVVDLMQQTSIEIKALLENTELADDIEAAYPGELTRLKSVQTSLEEDLKIAYQNTDSDETPLTKDSLSGADVRKLLGQLDTSDHSEYLGPAPDGFETVIDPYEELNEQPIKASYQQIENVVLSGNNKQPSENSAQNIHTNEKITSQTPENGVKRKLSFSLGNKQNKPTEN